MRLFFRLLPQWFGLACAGTVFVLIASNVLSVLFSMLGLSEDAPIVLSVMVVTHAVFIVAASRSVIRATHAAGAPPFSLTGWLTGTAVLSAIIGAFAFVMLRFSPPPAPLGFVTVSAALLACTPIVPAITAGPALKVSLARCLKAVVLSLPLLMLTAMLGWPAQVCEDECWGLLEGGLIMLPIVGAHLFIGSATAAFVPTFAFTDGAEQPQ